MKVSAAVLAAFAAVGIRSASAAEPTPVTRVVKLLEELKTRLESDEVTEQAKYDKFACWCEDTTAKKAEDITTARTTLKSLGNQILELKGTIATRIAEIKQLSTDIKENEAAQEMQTAVRTKENTAYLAEKTEMEQAVNALERAIIVLKGAGTAPASLRQTRADLEKWSVALAALRETFHKLPPRSQPDAKHVAMLAQLGSGYTPQSATVQGILSDMYSSFSETLQRISADEATKHRNYEDVMATYQKELVTLQETLVTKEQEKVAAEANLADSEVQYADIEKQLAADVEYFDATKASCVAKTDEWSDRKTLRAEEVAGIDKALAILTSDEAKELFSKAIKPGVGAASFLQLASIAPDTPAARAQQTLKSHARMTQSLRLAALAAKVAAGGHFDEVIKAIDAMMVQLADENTADQVKVDTCRDNYQKLDLAIQENGWNIEKSTAKMEELQALIDKRVAEKAEVSKQLVEVNASLAGMESNRTADNAAYVQAKSDDEKAIDLLQQAKTALEEYYAKNGVEVGPLGNDFLQRGARRADPIVYENQPPETEFSKKGHRKLETKGALAAIANIIEDLKSELSGTKQAEEQAQLDYEKQLAAAQALQEEYTNRIVSLEQTIANRRSDLQDETDKKTNHEADGTSLNQTKADIKPGCDFFLKNQAERARKRGLEMDGLRQAKEYLVGYRPPAMLQRKRRGAEPRSLGLERITFATVA